MDTTAILSLSLEVASDDWIALLDNGLLSSFVCSLGCGWKRALFSNGSR